MNMDELDHALRKQRPLRLWGKPYLVEKYRPLTEPIAYDAVQSMLASIGHKERFEFVVVAGGRLSESALAALARRLRSALHTPFTIGELTLDLEVSIGTACTPDDGADIEAAIHQPGERFETPAQPLAVQIGKRVGQIEPQRSTLAAQWRLVDDAGHPDRQHVPGTDRGGNDA